MNALKIFNTLNSKKEIFIPIDKNHIKVYACGPTVYNFAHIGNARMAVVFDTFVRTLRVIYPKVTYVSNITDIDDKIIEAAKEQNAEITEITEKYTQIYNEDMSMLNVLKPDIQPKATEYIPEMIELIKDLISKEFAYEKDGHVLFHVPSYSMYGELSNRNREEQIAGSRVEVAPFKKDPSDFVLWKPSNNTQPGWDSPWGFGRPGWHTECSAMSEKTLGLPFDIHGGGRDLIFPHHENEIAQSCCSSANIDEPDSYAKYWMHNGFVTIDGEKMSKSRGTFFNARTYLDFLEPEYLRYYFASRLTSKIEDIDLNFDDFQSRVNSDLIGKIINIGSRCAKFINKDFNDSLAISPENNSLIKECLSCKEEIIQNYELRNYSTNIRLISSLADKINKYLDSEKPWVKIKNDSDKELVQRICTDGLNLFRILIGYLKPILPNISKKTEDILMSESIN